MKNLLIIGGMAIAGIAVFGKRKAKEITDVVNRLKVKPSKLRNIKLVNGGVSLFVDLQIVNPTDIPLTITGADVVKLAKIDFYSPGGIFLGTSSPDLGALEVPANDGVVLTNIPAQISTQNAGEVLTSLIGIAGGGQKQLKYKLHFDALGKMITINA